MKTKFFKYKVDGIVLEPYDDCLEMTQAYDQNEILRKLNDQFKDERLKVVEQSLVYKIIDQQLFAEGLLIQVQEPSRMGYFTT